MDKLELKQLLLNFFESDEESIRIPYITLTEYSELLAELGCNTVRDNSINLMHDGNDYDTNGWQVDFWWRFKRNERKYCLGGSLFYGNFSIDYITEEDEE